MKKLLGILVALTLVFTFVGSISANTDNVCPEGYLKEETPMESLSVPCSPAKSYVTSSNSLSNGVPYVLEASGTCNWRTPSSASGYLADAEYWLRHDQYGKGWTKMNPGSIAFWNGSSAVNIDWGDYSDTHVYPVSYTPTADGQATFYFYDDQYGDNSGSLKVDIYQCKAAPLARTAEITEPTEGEVVFGSLDLGAYLIDDDEDPVQWAVRKGTCAAGTNNIIGNVDGMNDDYDWEADSSGPNKYLFTATADISSWEEGMYCFVFNPTEGSGEGETNIRLTREFYVDDGDGLTGGADYCPSSMPDEPSEQLGINRWVWDYSGWVTEHPKNGKGPNKSYTISQTAGCSCSQILTWLNTNYPEEYGEMEGHWKFGCSSSVLDDFISLLD